MLFSASTLANIVLAFSISAAAAPVSTQSSLPSPVALNFKIVKQSTYKKSNPNANLPISRGQNRIQQASKAHSITIPNEGSYFLAQLEVGSDKQPVGVIVDTGSSDLWFPSKSSCDAPTKTTADSTLSGLPPPSSGCPLGSFDEDASSSYNSMNKAFSLYYGVEGYYTYAKGTWAKEDITWGDVTVDQLQFGLATDQDIGQGIIGISYKGTEGVRQNDQYSNFPLALKNQGKINKLAYSLYLNSNEAEAGTILFGGIDKAKFDGNLTMLDIINVNDAGTKEDEAVAFFVNFNGMQQNGEQLFSESHPGLLDSGSTLLYAPESIYKSVAPKYGTYNSTAGGYITPCNSKGENFKFQFDNNLTIEVPYEQLLFNISDSSNLFTNEKGEEMCLFSMLSSSEDVWIMGDVFLRSAYIYYDMEESKIGLAQAVYTNETNIITV